YDFIIPCSHQMADWCHSMGVPEDKLVVVPNACGYPVEDELVEQILTRRWQFQDRKKLKILFLGRFARQKGLDRLLAVVTESRRRKLPIQWRLVGKNVLKDENSANELQTITDLIEPPALTSEAINEVYEWADVLLLPSYWEGLPLTVLEAMRLGVVVCASNVGAMEEVVDDGETGFLIPNLKGDGYVEAVMKVLTKLINEPEEVRKISQTAAMAAAQRNWSQACAGLIEKLNLVLKA
ncbi:glycosyltransferase family 4 protein, partial [Okeania sp.]|uniref:glycosyltransferase family 4 protein n=1 Tax=Okeania sp. TaxID=3100323 RepID=UPI002B4AFAB8